MLFSSKIIPTTERVPISKEIKHELEIKHGPLKKVSVAAAGRALKTEQASISMNIKKRPIFTEEDIHRLELQAVQQAQQQLLQQKEDAKTSHYYCVGYSVLYYKLDGEEIGSLVDQQGDEAQIEVIAYCEPGKEPIVFEGITKGKIDIKKSGSYGWSWDFVFIPEGETKTLGCFPDEERWKFWSLDSYKKLVEYLEKKSNN